MHLGTYWRGAMGGFFAAMVVTVLCVPRLCLAETSATDGLSPTRTYSWHQATAAAAWTPRYGHAALVFNHRIWALGGSPNLYKGLNDVWSTADGVNWVQATGNAPWHPRMYHAAVQNKNNLYILGGGEIQGYDYNDIWFSKDGIAWSIPTTPSPWPSCLSACAQSFRTGIYLMSGDGITPNDVWYSPDGSAWSKILEHAPWDARESHRAIVFLDRLWIFGGAHYDTGLRTSVYLNDMWSTVDGVNWVEETADAGWHKRSMFATAVFDNQLWVLGGSYSNGEGPHYPTIFLNDVWRSADGVHWSQAPTAAWLPRKGFDAVTFRNRLWMLGGRTPGPEGSLLLNDVWYMAPDPGASFSGAPFSGVAPLTVQFTDDSTAEATTISSWNWDFGDGTSSTERNPSHTYSTRGIYTVSLTVTAGDFYNTATEEAYVAVTDEGHPFHSADPNQDNKIALSELLRVIQFFNSGGFQCQAGTEDGYAPGRGGNTGCAFYDSDYYPPDWKINLTEVLRVIQFFNMHGYHACPGQGTEDGYCPGAG